MTIDVFQWQEEKALFVQKGEKWVSSVCPKGRGGGAQAGRLCFSILHPQEGLQPGPVRFRSRQGDFSFCCQYREQRKSTSEQREALPGDLPQASAGSREMGMTTSCSGDGVFHRKGGRKSLGYTRLSLGTRSGFPSHSPAQEPFPTSTLHPSSFRTWPSTCSWSQVFDLTILSSVVRNP